MNSNEYMNDNGATPIVPLPNPGEGGPVDRKSKIGRASCRERV